MGVPEQVGGGGEDDIDCGCGQGWAALSEPRGENVDLPCGRLSTKGHYESALGGASIERHAFR